MKKALILALALVALVGCDKKSDPNPAEAAYYDLYTPVSNQSYFIYQLFDRAQRLNILLQEADDPTQLNEVKSNDEQNDYTLIFFGSATLSNDNGVVTIDYGYGDAIYGCKGSLVIDTHNQLLSDEGAQWEFIEVSSNKYGYRSGYSAFQIVDSWEQMTITNDGGELVCVADDVVICREGGKGDRDGNWTLNYRVVPSSGSDESFAKFVEGTRTIKAASSASGLLQGRTEQYSHRFDQPSMMALFIGDAPPYEDFVAEGYQTVSSPEFAATNPEKYPASSISSESYLVGNTSYVRIHYNGLTWNPFN